MDVASEVVASLDCGSDTLDVMLFDPNRDAVLIGGAATVPNSAARCVPPRPGENTDLSLQYSQFSLNLLIPRNKFFTTFSSRSCPCGANGYADRQVDY